MSLGRRARLLCLASVGLTLAACRPKDTDPPDSPPPGSCVPADDQKHGGQWILGCAATLPGRDLLQQATISRANQDVAAARRELRTANSELRTALSAAVQEGNVSTRALAPQIEAVEQAARAAGQALVTALATTHKTLRPEQRARIMRTYRDASVQQHGRQWRAKLAGEQARLEQALFLNARQREHLGAGTATAARSRKRRDDLFAAFGNASFDLSAAGIPEGRARRAGSVARRRVELIAAVLPILKDDQPRLLARYLREAPDAE